MVDGTVADGWDDSLANWITTTTTSAREVRPDLAGAYFLRGWAENLVNPGDPAARRDVERAAQLDPGDSLFSQGAAYLQNAPGRVVVPIRRERVQFAAGATSATIRASRTEGGPSLGYVLGIQAGQRLQIRTLRRVGIVVLDPADQPLIATQSSIGNWSGTIPRTSDYTIVLTGESEATVTVTIPPL